jgi:membrane-bound lytic murein transglycosylase D
MIHRIFAEEGVPQELLHLAQAESGFYPMAVSHKAAVGMWQFVAFTGAQYGLDRSTQHDHRLDPERATRAAARHLRDLYNQTGDWYLAMAAYNCGPACVERAVQRTGYADFWELRRRSALPRETMNYIPAILAMAIVSKNLDYYGLQAPGFEPALEYDTLAVSSPTSLTLVADAADVAPGAIRELNPSILRGVAPAGFEIRVPKDKRSAISAALDAVPDTSRASWRLHRISNGDTLASIARQYATAPNQILAANARLTEAFFNAPEAGEVLLIPAKAKPEPVKIAKSSKPSSRKYKASASRRGAKAPAQRVASKRSAPRAKARG